MANGWDKPSRTDNEEQRQEGHTVTKSEWQTGKRKTNSDGY